MVRATNDPARQPWLALQRCTGDPVTAGAVTVTLLSRVLTLRLPWGALVWHRPVAVLVARDGRTTRLPIRDATRLAQCAIVGASVLLALAGRTLASSRKGSTS